MNISDPLSPYLPLALLVATVVALLRGLLSDAKGVSKLDGKAVVLPVVAFFSVGVVAWSHLHTGVVWTKVAMDAPIVFLLAAGGATFLQRLKDRGLLAITGEVAELKVAPAMISADDVKALGEAMAALQAAMKPAATTTTATSQTTISGTVVVKPADPPVVPPAPPSLDVPLAPPAG